MTCNFNTACSVVDFTYFKHPGRCYHGSARVTFRKALLSLSYSQSFRRGCLDW